MIYTVCQIVEGIDGPKRVNSVLKLTEKIYSYAMVPVEGPCNRRQQEHADCKAKQRAKEAADKAEFDAAWKQLTVREREMYNNLNAFIDGIYAVNVDVSYYPHAARMAQITHAKRIARI